MEIIGTTKSNRDEKGYVSENREKYLYHFFFFLKFFFLEKSSFLCHRIVLGWLLVTFN